MKGRGSRALRVAAFFLLLHAGVSADVVLLKDGAKVSGKVVDKTTHYEVTTEAGLRTYLKEEVEKVVTSPREFLGDADALYEEARREFERALPIASPAEQGVVLRGA